MDQKAAVKGKRNGQSVPSAWAEPYPAWYRKKNERFIRELVRNRFELKRGCNPEQRRALIERNRRLREMILGSDCPAPNEQNKMEAVLRVLTDEYENLDWVNGAELASTIFRRTALPGMRSDSMTAAESASQ